MTHSDTPAHTPQALGLLVWLLIAGTGLSRGAFFLCMPFLALHLSASLGADPTTIGLVIGAGPLVGTFAAFFMGSWSDRVGRKAILVGSLLGWALTFAGFALSSSLAAFLACSLSNGLCRAAFEPTAQALIADRLPAPEDRSRAFHLRYFAINVGATVGPPIGAWLDAEHMHVGFLTTAGVHVVFATALALALRGVVLSAPPQDTSDRSFRAALRVLAADSAMRLYVVAGFLTSFAYVQLNTTFPLILEGLHGKAGVTLFGWVIGTNAAVIVICQLPLNRWTARFPLNPAVALACVPMGLGFVGFGFASGHAAFLLSMVVLALGECVVFSNGNVLIDRLAPTHLRGAYFGAQQLRGLGFAIGSVAGGALLSSLGRTWLFVIVGGGVFLAGGLYLLGGRFAARSPGQHLPSST